MGRAMYAFAGIHERPWHFLASFGPDIALLREAVPSDRIRGRFQVHRDHAQAP